MKTQLSLFYFVFIFIVTASLDGQAQFATFEGPIEPGGGFNQEPRNIHIPKKGPFVSGSLLPKIVVTPYETLRFRPVLEWVDVGSSFDVTITTASANPPSCLVVAQRMRNEQVRRSEIENYINKVSAGKMLSNEELKSLKMISRGYLPGILDVIDQEVRMDIVWKFDKDMFSSVFRLPGFESGPINDFSKYVLIGPGLSWDNSDGGPTPDFLKVNIDTKFYLSYSMSMLDFCFADNIVTVIGKNEHAFSDEDSVLKATWQKDPLMHFQSGRIVTKQRQSFVRKPL